MCLITNPMLERLVDRESHWELLRTSGDVSAPSRASWGAARRNWLSVEAVQAAPPQSGSAGQLVVQLING